MKRRLLLARALMHEPQLVILDEPTAGVDFELRLELWRYIRRLHELGTTILLTTHYLEEAEELCEDIALIRDGRIIARDTADGLRAAYGVGLARRRLRARDGGVRRAVALAARAAGAGRRSSAPPSPCTCSTSWAPGGTVFLRLLLATIVLSRAVAPAAARPYVAELRLVLGFGIVLGLMNWSFYEAPTASRWARR